MNSNNPTVLAGWIYTYINKMNDSCDSVHVLDSCLSKLIVLKIKIEQKLKNTFQGQLMSNLVILMNEWKHSNWKHLSVSVLLLCRVHFSLQWLWRIRISLRILGNIFLFSGSVREVRAYHCRVVSRFTFLMCCVIWQTPSRYKLNITSVNMHLVTERWPPQTPRGAHLKMTSLE